ncbi:MAG: hypothetical protein B0D92_04215 [Spirochaeta sp. LUC14_002_19_P3]|nr:MAG: hypothetical protein B0D92_04215 [Spirochaeta sp. LUC14_002_19_P3]
MPPLHQSVILPGRANRLPIPVAAEKIESRTKWGFLEVPDSIKGLGIPAAAATGTILYAYFAPEGGAELYLSGLAPFRALSEDLLGYFQRFAASFLFLGLLPFLSFIVLRPGRAGFKGTARQVGLCRPSEKLFSQPYFAVILTVSILMGALGAFDPGLSSFYPYSKALTVHSANKISFLLHALCYLVFYYIPWELLFRGILLLGLLPLFFGEDWSRNPWKLSVLVFASLQSIPSALLHFGHPLSESLSAVLFGIVSAGLTLHYKSIWPAFIVHGCTGLALDAAIVLRTML